MIAFLAFTLITYSVGVFAVLFCCYEQLRNLVFTVGVESNRQELTRREMARVREAENNQFDSTGDGECPICINKMEGLKTLALCRHAFCAPCITNYIKSKGGEMIGCPFCRKSVTYLAI
jgi:Zinc finger, C3HC4 type (RING finger)